MFIKIKNIQFIIPFLILFLFISCNTSSNSVPQVNDSKKEIDELTPGLGEYMIQLEYHHQKIGKAIVDTNYKRIDYELDELQEVFEKIEYFHNNHEKLKETFEQNKNAYLTPTINLLKSASSHKQKDSCVFFYNQLTSNCNSCHAANQVEFISIK